MSRLWVLARMALVELFFEKAFYIIAFSVVVLFMLSHLFGTLSFDEQQKIFADFGYLSIQLSTLGIALFFGAYSLHKEIEKQTCLILLTRPITRVHFILGKFFGLAFLNLIVSIVIGVFMLFYLDLDTEQLYNHSKIVTSIFMQSNIYIGIAMLFALLVRPILSLLVTASIFLAGFSIEDIRYFGNRAKVPMYTLAADVLNWLTPQMYKMNWKSYFFIQDGIPSENFIWMLLHTFTWTLLVIFLVQFIFRRKDLV